LVYESPHKRQCDKASILIILQILYRKIENKINIIIKSLGLIKTEEIDSGTNFVGSSIAEFGPNH